MLGQIIATIYIFDAFCLTFSTIESSCLDVIQFLNLLRAMISSQIAWSNQPSSVRQLERS